MSSSPVGLLDSLTALSDPTRCRMLLLLEEQELTVSEICSVLQLPQSTVSRHLKTLVDVGLLTSRRDGTSRFYSLSVSQDEGAPAQAELWQLTRREFASRPNADQDARRLARVLVQRGETSQQFFASAAGQWDRMRDDLFGADAYLGPLLGLLPASWVVGDLGCGTGAVMSALAPYVARMVGIDASDEMLRAAESRLGGTTNTELRRGTLEALPIEDQSLDAATMVLVLHHLPSPALAIGEAHRVLKSGGRLLIVDMAPHEREEYRRQMGHVWLGFSQDQIQRLLTQAGFKGMSAHALPPKTAARGPALFAVSAAKEIQNSEF
jgi:ubiquinone/menaquinone biosynthesis C-methylase UbiE/DNA-binding transcriptional ArsR family regulator